VQPVIKIENLSFTYSKKTPYQTNALRNINLEINEGEIVGIIGETGSGKSTLIQHFNALLKVQNKKKSKVEICGLDASVKKNLKEIRKTVGVCFQYPEHQLFEDTVEKDISYGPKNLGANKEEIPGLVYRAMRMLDLDESFNGRNPFQLSGGEKRRVAIAGIIVMQPKILILDEPMAGLDPIGKIELKKLIKRLHTEVSPTIVIVSHDMDDIAEIADRVLILSKGEIVVDKPVREAFNNEELIKGLHLDLPSARKIANKLIAKGVKIRNDVLTMKELEEEILRYAGV
jgi:cobalt import ATP-binding protein cbiO 1